MENKFKENSENFHKGFDKLQAYLKFINELDELELRQMVQIQYDTIEDYRKTTNYLEKVIGDKLSIKQIYEINADKVYKTTEGYYEL
jgi:hypothetical protein